MTTASILLYSPLALALARLVLHGFLALGRSRVLWRVSCGKGLVVVYNCLMLGRVCLAAAFRSKINLLVPMCVSYVLQASQQRTHSKQQLTARIEAKGDKAEVSNRPLVFSVLAAAKRCPESTTTRQDVRAQR
jgi:hypothetical protein